MLVQLVAVTTSNELTMKTMMQIGVPWVLASPLPYWPDLIQ
jgi:hypothetical protein